MDCADLDASRRSDGPCRRWSHRHPRLAAGLGALVGGVLCALAIASLLSSIVVGGFAKVLPGCLIPVPICSAMAMLLFGPWLRSRRPTTGWLAVSVGMAWVFSTMIITAGAAGIAARTQRALAQGLTFGSAAYFDFVLEGTAPLHVLDFVFRSIMIVLVVGSSATFFLPEIIGALAGYTLWRIVRSPAGSADAAAEPGLP